MALLGGPLTQNLEVKMLQQRRQNITWDNYVTFGLVARYQGSNNTGFGHSNSTVFWKDLVGNADLSLTGGLVPGTRRWGSNYFESLKVNVTNFTWLSSQLPSSFSPENCTLEVVFMPYAGADNTGGGDIIGIDDIESPPYTTVTLEMNSLNASFLVEESATFVTLNRRPVVANTIYSVSMPVSPFNPIPAQNGAKGIYYNGIRQYRANRTANLFVQLPVHLLNLASNPVLNDIKQIFFGRIYEVRVYNRALSESEIALNASLDLQIYTP